MAEIVKARIVGDWRRVIGDEIVSHETTDIGDAGIHGTVTLSPVWERGGPQGVIADPGAHYSIHPVECRVRYGRLYDPTNTHPYEDVVVEIDGQPLVWEAKFNLAYRRRTGEKEVPLTVKPVTFDSSAMVAGQIALTGILPAAAIPDAYKAYFTNAALSASTASEARDVAVDAADTATGAAVQAVDAADAAAAQVPLAKAEADRAIGLANAQDEHIAGTLEDPDSATHAAFKAVGNATYGTKSELAPRVARAIQDPVTEKYPERPDVAHVEYVGWTEPGSAVDFDTYVQMPTRPASDVLFTDFTGYPDGETPPTWLPTYDTAGSQWVVRSGAGFGGGPALCHEGISDSSLSRRGVLWTAVDDDPDRTQAEIVVRFKVDHVANSALLVCLDASGSTGTSGDITAIRAGMEGGSQVRISRYVSGGYTVYATGLTGSTIGPGLWVWVRAQVDGNTVRVRLWREEIGGAPQSEPAEWHVSHAEPGFKAAGRIGLLSNGMSVNGATMQVIDRVGIGLNGEAAPTVAP